MHIYHIWLHTYYIVIQPYCHVYFSAILYLEIKNLGMSLDKVLILVRYSLLEAELRWSYYSLSLHSKQEIQHHAPRYMGKQEDLISLSC